MWNSAVFVPKAYLDTSEGSRTVTLSEPVGQEVQTPPCLVQKEQVQARAGICDGSGAQVRVNEMFLQWQLPEISIGAPRACSTQRGAHRRAECGATNRIHACGAFECGAMLNGMLSLHAAMNVSKALRQTRALPQRRTGRGTTEQRATNPITRNQLPATKSRHQPRQAVREPSCACRWRCEAPVRAVHGRPFACRLTSRFSGGPERSDGPCAGTACWPPASCFGRDSLAEYAASGEGCGSSRATTGAGD